MVLEPAFPAALEQQAIARIVRVGQTQQTFVYRYIVRHTVEQRLTEIAEQEERAGLGNALAGANDANDKQLSANAIASILEDPSAVFDPPPVVRDLGLELHGDEDEEWWACSMQHNGASVARSVVLERLMKREARAGEDVVGYHGVEIPRVAMIELERLMALENMPSEDEEEEDEKDADSESSRKRAVRPENDEQVVVEAAVPRRVRQRSSVLAHEPKEEEEEEQVDEPQPVARKRGRPPKARAPSEKELQPVASKRGRPRMIKRRSTVYE